MASGGSGSGQGQTKNSAIGFFLQEKGQYSTPTLELIYSTIEVICLCGKIQGNSSFKKKKFSKMLLDFMSVHNFVETHQFSLLFEVTLDLVSFYILPIQNNTLISRLDCNSPFLRFKALHFNIAKVLYDRTFGFGRFSAKCEKFGFCRSLQLFKNLKIWQKFSINANLASTEHWPNVKN